MTRGQIDIRAEFAIQEGKADEFMKLAQDMSRAVEAGEPDTIGYQFYLDGARCIVHETYASSEAALAHHAGAASQAILPKIFSVASLSRLEVYGDPSEKLQKTLAGFGARIYRPFAGYSR